MPFTSSLSSLLVPAGFHHSHCFSPVTVIWPVQMSLHGTKHRLQGSRTPWKSLKLFCCSVVTEAKPNLSTGPVTTVSVSTALHLQLPRELGREKVQIGEEQGKSGNWESLTPGSSEEKVLHLMGWDPGKAQAALSSANEAQQLRSGTGAVWCLWLSVLRKHRPGTENPAGKCTGKEMSAEQVKERGKPPHSVSVLSPQKGLLSIQATSWSQILTL